MTLDPNELQAALEALRAVDTANAAAEAALTAEIAALAPPVVTPPDPPPPATKAILTLADVHYLGLFTLPQDANDASGNQATADGTPMLRLTYSAGRIAGRRVDGQLRLAISQSQADHWTEPMVEIAVPDDSVLTTDLKTTGRATVVKNWGDIYQGKRLLETPYATRVGGYTWVTGTDGLPYLVWSYFDVYNTAEKWNPSIGCTRFNADGTYTAFGPWRTSVDSHKTSGFFVPIPVEQQALFGGRTLAIGSPQTAGDINSPWGASLFALPNLNPALAPDPIGPATENATLPKSLDVLTGLLQDAAHPLLSNPQYQDCVWVSMTKTPPTYDSSQGGILTAPRAGDEGGRQQSFGAAIWLELPTKHGLLYFGQAVMPHPDNESDPTTWPHAWYGPPTCPHGRVDSYSNGKGNHADQRMPVLAIYDPADVAAVVAGTMPPSAPQPVSLDNLLTLFNAAGLVGQNGLPAGYCDYLGGAWYDDQTGRLYLTCCNEDRVTSASPRPVIRVFQV